MGLPRQDVHLQLMADNIWKLTKSNKDRTVPITENHLFSIPKRVLVLSTEVNGADELQTFVIDGVSPVNGLVEIEDVFEEVVDFIGVLAWILLLWHRVAAFPDEHGITRKLVKIFGVLRIVDDTIYMWSCGSDCADLSIMLQVTAGGIPKSIVRSSLYHALLHVGWNDTLLGVIDMQAQELIHAYSAEPNGMLKSATVEGFDLA